MNGKTWKWVHFAAIFVFIAIWIFAAFIGLLSSVTFVSHMSMLALVYSAVSAWQGGRTEQKQEEDE